jgi:hypothetical protein
VIDTVGNTASELSSTALTLGDVNGNASLGKAGIEAANNLKDALSGEVTDTTNVQPIYDAASESLEGKHISPKRECYGVFHILPFHRQPQKR